MNMPSNGPGFPASLADAPLGLVLVARWTLLLALAWMAHAALARRNPRWRVTVWRGAVLGIGLIALLRISPPIVSIPLGPGETARSREGEPPGEPGAG